MMRALSQTHSVAFGFNQCSIYSEFRLQATLLLYISISKEQQQQLLGREPIGSRYRESYPIIFDSPLSLDVLPNYTRGSSQKPLYFRSLAHLRGIKNSSCNKKSTVKKGKN